jgi:hypothetical protein
MVSARTTEPLTVAGPRRIHTGFQLHGPFTHFDCAIRVAWRVRVWQPLSILLDLDDLFWDWTIAGPVLAAAQSRGASTNANRSADTFVHES